MAEYESPTTSLSGGRSSSTDPEKVDMTEKSPQDGNSHARSSEDSEQSDIRRIETAHAEMPEDPAVLTVSSRGPAHSIFTLQQKRYITFMVSWAGFFSPLSSNIYFPALNTLAAELHVGNELINLTLTSYMIFQGLAPSVFGDFADMAGRRPAYLIAFVVYIGANIGLALQDSYAALFVLRCLQSAGSSGTVALGNGVIADIATSAERGTWMGAALMGPMVGPAIGPVIGGVLSQFLGWRAIFWFLTIMAGVYLVMFSITVPETGRNVVGNGSVPPQGWNMSLLNYLQLRKLERSEDSLTRINSRQEKRDAQAAMAGTRKLRCPNPLNTIHIILEKDVGIILFYNSLTIAAFYDVAATLPSQFTGIYGYNDLQIGLCYIPFGVACAIAAFVNGRIMDWNYKRVAKAIGFTIDRKHGDSLQHFPIERARLEVCIPNVVVGVAALICYGWALHTRPPLAAPLVLLFIMGYCFASTSNVASTLLVDLYPLSPATATAANNLVRCLMGAGSTAVVELMILRMGVGPCFTFVALVIVAATPLLAVDLKWGPGWREERRVRMERKAKEVKERKNAAAV